MAKRSKGLAADRLTIDLIVFAGITVASATGAGYKGTHVDDKTKATMAEWQVTRLAATEERAFTITLSGPPANPADLKGTIRWAKPGPKSGPNLDVVNFAPRPAGAGR